MYKAILRIPVISSLLYITNSYVLRGDSVALDKFASPLQWLRVFFFPWFCAAALTSITVPSLCAHELHLTRIASHFASTAFESKAGEFITSIFPNLLGFGIGVYALIFAISDRFLSKFENHVAQKKNDGMQRYGSALVFNVDLAFPLIVIVAVISIGVLQQAYESVAWLRLFAWFSFWYAMITMIEIIAVLFGLGEHAILEKVSKEQQPKE
jgi:hypothetical protein